MGARSKALRQEYNLRTSATSVLERAVIVLLSPTRYPARASTASHPGIPLESHLVSCHNKYHKSKHLIQEQIKKSTFLMVKHNPLYQSWSERLTLLRWRVGRGITLLKRCTGI